MNLTALTYFSINVVRAGTAVRAKLALLHCSLGNGAVKLFTSTGRDHLVSTNATALLSVINQIEVDIFNTKLYYNNIMATNINQPGFPSE